MNVTLRQLRAFIAVAQTGSFTLAAESLFVTQSALSGLIKELEQSLGVRLFDRSTRRIKLSDVGRSIFPMIEKILHDLDDVLDELTNLKELKKGLVRIAAPQLMSCTLLPEVIGAYSESHPHVTIRLIDCVVESVVARVFSGEVDFGIGPERTSSSDITADLLFELPFMAVFHKDHAFSARDSVTWDDMAEHRLITLQGQFIERLSLDLRGSVQQAGLDPNTTVSFMSTALSMVAAGLGMTVCIPYAASLVRLYGLEMRPLIDPVVTRRFYLYTRNGRSLSPAAESFKNFLFDSISSLNLPGQK
ncbi:LysR family transcriptional regulator [Magnetospirillum sulfuroxidans]|uniref:LysR family transcriptional regulator n=1 Tax=Magnetospirillum sulfuroxidans TaxID=611300 RepID=A0ABS5IDI3_9PROT|nr:LysR family transcriptional regulator [Magnetospirillum sulfuroxidans]MBR9972475.1 LysR family transcriptional regulator [Magnetospirillum sulfuroxidans]